MTMEGRGYTVMYWGGVLLGTAISGVNPVLWWGILALSIPMFAWNIWKYPN